MRFALADLDQQPDLSKDESLIPRRQAKSWAADTATRDDLWRKRIKNDVIDLMTGRQDLAAGQAQLKKRYTTLQRASTSSRATTSSPIS